MRQWALFGVFLVFFTCFAAGLAPPYPGDDLCPGGTYPTIYLACYGSWQCPYRQHCYKKDPWREYGYCCPYPHFPKPY